MKLKEEVISLNIGKRDSSNANRERLYNKLYLGEIIDREKPKFSNNNLIMAPVGSGKSFLIEKRLIPEDYNGKALYLTSNTALKDSISPNNNETRIHMAKKGKSIKFFTSENKNRYGDKPYNVHVMTYHEFGKRILSPNQTFTDDIDLIFCDEIHSLPIFTRYGWNGELLVALRWLFEAHEDKTIYYFTATRESLDRLEEEMPGYMNNVKEFDYLEHPKIRRYEAKSTYYISHLNQLRMHLQAKVNYIKRHGEKGLAFTQRIEDQEKIAEIAKSEGYTPIVLWSVNNDKREMSNEQLKVRKYILETGNIPEPYNLLVINGAMQEGWNLFDNKVEFAILDTTDKTQQIQALGRVRKDIDFIIIKTSEEDYIAKTLFLRDRYLNTPLTAEDKDELSIELNVINNKNEILKWTSIRKMLSQNGYIVEDRKLTIDGKRRRVSIISES